MTDMTTGTILIVDDEVKNRKLLEVLLRPEGYLVTGAASGEEALALIAQQAPDLILLDVMMPGMDGYQVTSILKANPATSQIPIIVVSALDDRSARLLGLAAGAEEFLSKPIDRSELCLRVRNLLRLREYSNFYQNHTRILDEQVQARTADLQRFRSAMDATADAIFLTNRSTMRFVEVNATACSMLGYTREELFELGPTSFIAMTLEALGSTYDALIAGDGVNQMIETSMQRKNGSKVQVEVQRQVQCFGGDWIIVSVLRDITERKRITEALRASELQLRQITDTIPTLIAYLDTEQRFRFHNKAYEGLLGLNFEQINGLTLAEVLGRSAYEGIRDKVEEVLRGHVVHYERIQKTAQGDFRDYAIHFFPRYGEGADEGKVVGFFAHGNDITEFKRIDRMKTEFISTVSHELRTPLTSIRGSLGLIDGGVAGEVPKAVKNLVGIAKNNCERLIRLINDILDSEKIESGKVRLDLQPVDIKQLVEQTMAAMDGFAVQHEVKLQLRSPDGSLKVHIDSDRMIQVLTNLLSNAVKFSPLQSTVEVNVLRVARQVRVEVVDHGPGIPEEFRGRIFQKFSQADSSDSRQKGGSGLGLNISKALIEKMGGQIGFRSEAGTGATFFLELPEWQNPPTPPPPPPVQPVRTQAVLSRPRILVCEGDADLTRLISMMLGKTGFEADIAQHATQARAFLACNSYDAVMVDLNLPGQCGAAFISSLRGDPRTRNLPVIVISALVEEGLLQFNRKPLAISDWLKKPIDENLLIRSIRRAVASVQSGKPRILHVEDDPDVQDIVAAIAEDFADFEFAATLNEARARLRERRFDLVLLDLGLGQDSGGDLFKDIDALDPPPPVIVFSASDVDPDEGKQAEAVLVKARNSNTELLKTIQRVLQIPGNPGPTRPQPLT